MVDPENVISPKRLLQGPIDVIAKHRRNGEEGNYYSVAKFSWGAAPAVGIRWDGDPNKPNDVGNPQSRGLPTWFILPADIADVVVDYLASAPEVPPPSRIESAHGDSLDAHIETVVERVLKRLLEERSER